MASVESTNLEIHRGDDERLLATISPYTAAASLFFMAKRKFTDTDAAAKISKSLGSGIAVTVSGSLGVPAQAQIAIDRADTQVLPNAKTELFYELTDGANHTLRKGKLTVMPEVKLAAGNALRLEVSTATFSLTGQTAGLSI